MPPAQRNLGFCYEKGSGVKQDYSEAFKWIRKSAQNGLPDGQCALGFFYTKGWGVDQDYAEAFKWYRESALNGLPEGQFLTGLRYKNGRGVKKDEVEAYAYFHLASPRHDAARQERDLLKKHLTKEQIAAGQRRAKELQTQIEAKSLAK